MKLESIPPGQAKVFARLRALCLAFPGASEEIKWGHPNWVVNKKIFASYGTYHDRPSFGSKQTLAQQAILVEDPRFFVSPYVGKHGWTSMYTDKRVAWGLVEELIENSYRLVAPKRSIAELDGAAVRPAAGKKAAKKKAAKKKAARKKA